MNKILICIISFNRQPLLKFCLESLFNNTKTPFDLIIVDNNSAGPTKRLLKHFENRTWPNSSTSNVIYNATNIGTTDVYYDIMNIRKNDQYLVMMGNDTQAPEDNLWLENLINIIETPEYNIDVLGCSMWPYQDIVEASSESPIITPYGTLIIVPVNISSLSCYSPKFLKELIFEKINKNNFEYNAINRDEERQIVEHSQKYGLRLACIYNDTLKFIQKREIMFHEFNAYNDWKKDLFNSHIFKDFILEENEYAEDTSPLNIKIIE